MMERFTTFAALIGIVVCAVLYVFVSNQAVDKRVVSHIFRKYRICITKITDFRTVLWPACSTPELMSRAATARETMEEIGQNGKTYRM